MFRSHKDIARSTVNQKERSTHEHNEYEWYSCDMCSQQWQSETEVEIHRSEHERELVFKMEHGKESMCLYCMREFPTEELLRQHINVDHLLSSPDARRVEREIFICSHCTQLFFNKLFLVLHMAIVHKNVKKEVFGKCPKCYRMIRIHNMWSHFLFHNIQSVSTCPICFEKCKNRKDLNAHVNTHPKYLFCNPCGYEAKTQSAFNEHIDKHRQKSTKKFLKTTEGKITPIRKYFLPRRVVWQFNRRLKVFKGFQLDVSHQLKICVLCREITNKQNMAKHMRTHRASSVQEYKKTYNCVCGETFFNGILLKQHLFKLKGNHKQAEEGIVTLVDSTQSQRVVYVIRDEMELASADDEDSMESDEEVVAVVSTSNEDASSTKRGTVPSLEDIFRSIRGNETE